jgi:hypothetical protein
MFKSALALALAFAASTLTLTSQSAHAASCSTGFIEAYKKVIVEIKTIGVAVKDKKVPTNLVSAVRACNRLEGSFTGYRCEVGTQTAGADDLSDACLQIREMAKSLNIEIPSETPPPKTADANTAVSVGLALQIKNAGEISKVVAAPKSFYFINGRSYDLASSVLVKGEVRCTIAFPGIEKSSTPAQAGQVLKANLITEEVAHDHYYTRVAFEGVNWTLDCAKHAYSADEAKTGTTFGELKAALGSNADFAYQN